MKEQITLSRKEAELLTQDLAAWATVLEGDGVETWPEEMYKHARILEDKLAGRIE